LKNKKPTCQQIFIDRRSEDFDAIASDQRAQRRWRTYIAASEVTSLEHEVLNAAVEGRSLEAEALLAGAERAEVLSRLRHNISAQLHSDAAGRRAADGHVKKHLGVRHTF
jgi:hypothetical protein